MLSKKSMMQTRLLLASRSRLTAMTQAALPAHGGRAMSSAPKDNFLSGSNANYIDYVYAQWQQDPSSVHASWNAYFTSQENGGSFDLPPTLGSGGASLDGQVQQILAALQSSGGMGSGSADVARAQDEAVRLTMLLRAYMTHGHFLSETDPLELQKHYEEFPTLAQKFRFASQELKDILDPKRYGFTEADLDKEIFFKSPFGGSISQKKSNWKLRELLSAYKEAYCGKIGVQFMHIEDKEKRDWIRERVENIIYEEKTEDQKVHMYERLNWSHSWGAFMAGKFNTMKRFGLEGCESFVPGLKYMIDSATENGARVFVIGMAHRGRLNTLANVVRKPMEVIMAEFQGITPMQNKAETQASGDVKYHLGTTFKRSYGENGVDIKITLMANPSHLEAVNPCVGGRARAEQHFLGGREEDRKKVVPIVVHGDAAIAGQGIVYECLQMERLPDYNVGGTVHVVINNQVGFTTTPDKGRSTTYCTDVAQTINAPIFHVNAQCMEEVSRVFKIAAEYRQKFGRDVVIDLVGYRKMGHNELDQPMFTQPLMYNIIKNITPVRDLYRKQLIAEGIAEDKIKAVEKNTQDKLNEAYQKSKDLTFEQEEWASSKWQAIQDPKKYGAHKDTGVDTEVVRDIGLKISTLPENKKFHPQVAKIFKAREKAFVDGANIDWGTAEAVAFATLIQEGYHVRLSGQDVARGTFSHRHAYVFYQDEDGHYTPINSVASQQDSTRTFIASNSHLSEYAVLGFEFGYAQTSPDTLCLWEAQFGDFANGAQIMIDQFITSAEQKWNVKNGLVMLLPHGYDGAGPEHSSGRMERFLQLSDADDQPPSEDVTDHMISEKMNMAVCYPTTAANYFHLLRRQIRRPFRKPLICLESKKLMKYRGAMSTIEDFRSGLRFQKVIDETSDKMVADAKVRRVIFCSGQIYYDLEAERTKQGANDVAIVRVEQVAPFPFRHVERSLRRYSNAEVMWAQEEPKNQGAWSFVEPRLVNQLDSISHKSGDVAYAGRDISASTATGYGKKHTGELASYLKTAFA